MKVSAHTKRAGFTLIELLVVVSIIALLIGILLPALGRARKQAQQLTDGTQVREIQRALLNFAQDNGDFYPRPSAYDRYDYTEGNEPDMTTTPNSDVENKNRSGAVFSILITDGQVVTQQCVSPAEADGTIRPDPNFQTSAPELANRPNRALWDPAFIGTRDQNDGFWNSTNTGLLGTPDRKDDITIAGEGSNLSYAHLPIAGARLGYWGATYSATQIVLGNRGPAYIVDGNNDPINATWTLLGTPEGSSGVGDPNLARQGFQSTTLLIHGGRRSWEGNIGFNDNHVEFASSPTPANVRIPYQGDGGNEEQVPDNIFFDEDWEGGDGLFDEQDRANVYLRQWAHSIAVMDTLNLDGNSPGDWNLGATWDGKPTWGDQGS